MVSTTPIFCANVTELAVKNIKNIKKTFIKHRVAYFFVLPSVVAMLLMHFSPLMQGIYMSFTKLDLYNFSKYLKAPFVGLDNYYAALFDTSSPVRLGLLAAVRNTIIYAIVEIKI